MPMVIVDYCKGNLASVQRGFAQAGYEAIISSDSADILSADAIVLPGVGAFSDAMEGMMQMGQDRAIKKRVLEDGVPFLGICLGMHLLFDAGEEGAEELEGGLIPGLGILKGTVRRLPKDCPDGSTVKIPHVGWNTLDFEGCQPSPLLEGIPQGSHFYFTHSYAVQDPEPRAIIACTSHARPFVCAVGSGLVFGTQFHPEKSSALGLRVLENFGRIVYERS